LGALCILPTPYSTLPEGFWITPYSPNLVEGEFSEIRKRLCE
jgi:hypothetical protein